MKPKDHTRLFAWLVRHYVVAFVTMTIMFVIFGVLSVNMVNLIIANAGFIIMHGWDAITAGGFVQLIQLWLMILIANGTYLMFKLCEHALIQHLAHENHDEAAANENAADD